MKAPSKLARSSWAGAVALVLGATTFACAGPSVPASAETEPQAPAAATPLPSWNDGPAKAAIVEFVEAAVDPSSPGFIAPADRIATFDNDGTLWTEHPVYTQLAFVLDRVRELAPEHPEWKTRQPFTAVLEGDLEAVKASGTKGLLELVLATHAGMTTDAFEAVVRAWFAEAKHPRFERPYTDLAYQPMLELLAFLRQNGFQTFIVSGGGVEFMRPWTEAVYGIPPQNVVGSTIRTTYELVDGEPAIVRRPELDFINDKAGKPVGIHRFIGRRPVVAFGNSAGDRQMLEWTTAGEGPRLAMLLFHDDAEREYAYGPARGLEDTHVGAFPEALMQEGR